MPSTIIVGGQYGSEGSGSGSSSGTGDYYPDDDYSYGPGRQSSPIVSPAGSCRW